MITGAVFPILVTADLPRLRAFYADGLEAVEHYRFPAEGEPGYVSLRLGEQSLGLGFDPAAPGDRGRISVWCYVDDCDATVDRLVAAGGTVTEPPADQPWGERVAKLLDPDGNELIIGRAA